MGKNPKLNNWRLCVSHGEVVEYLIEHGGSVVRRNGSHWIVRGPNGKSFPVQNNHPSWRMVPEMKSKIRRKAVEAGIEIVEV